MSTLEHHETMKQPMKMMPGMEYFQPVQITMKDFPIYKFFYDNVLLIRKLPYLLFLNGGTHMLGKEETDELYFNVTGTSAQLKSTFMNVYSVILNLFLIAVTLTYMFVSGLTISFLPIWVMLGVAFWFSPMLIWMLWPPTLKRGTNEGVKFREEKWFYINGVAVNGWWQCQIQKKLETMFGRPVTMIQNKTFGVICDMLSIPVLRNANYPTMTFKLTYNALKNALEDNSVRKVVLLAHSEGGIMASMVIERLLVEMDVNQLNKLEIYTFGSAADKFVDGRGKIQHIEHFANWYDYVAQTGVLHFKNMYPKFYSGTVYMAENFGHWFNQHYSRGITERAFKSVEGKTPRLYHYLNGQSPEQSH